MLKKAFQFVLFLLPLSLFAGFFLGLWQLEVLPGDKVELILKECGNKKIFILFAILQAMLNTTFFGFCGYLLANKICLWTPIKLEKKKLKMTLVISFLGGLLFSLDPWMFGKFINIPIQQNNISVVAFLSSILYGGIIEELMLRLFFMSLLVLILQKIFFQKQDQIPQKVFIISNIISAFAFAAGHLPMTIELFGSLTPIIIFRCFLLNGGFGLMFGWFYRKYGIHYAMLSHAMLHLVSKIIWLFFI